MCMSVHAGVLDVILGLEGIVNVPGGWRSRAKSGSGRAGEGLLLPAWLTRAVPLAPLPRRSHSSERETPAPTGTAS